MDLLKKMSVCLVLIITMAFHAFAQSDFCGIKNTSFQDGEKLSFKVYYNMGRIWITAGEAVLAVNEENIKGRETFHIVGDGKTVRSYEWFYKVRDKYETYIDKQTMLPVKFVRNVNEGGYKINNFVTFDHNRGEAVSTNGVFTVPKCVQDILSAIYYARNINFDRYKPGDKIPFSLFLDDKVYSLYIRYIGKEEITTRSGTYKAIKIAPLLIEGTIFKGGEKMVVWITDDYNHIPLRVNSPILIGSVKVDLMNYERLRNPFSSLIEKKDEDE